MPKIKKSTKATQSHEMIDAKTEDLMIYPAASRLKNKKWGKLALLILVVLLAYLAFRGGYIMVATVNGKPIYRWEFSKNIVSRFGAQTLESMITERLIDDAAQQEGISLTKAEVDTKLNDIVKTLWPDVKLEDLLKYQGMTKADFEQQIRLQLTVERVLGKDVAVTDTDIDAYIKENKATMTATEAGAMREEAKTSLVSQKISEKIQPWLTDLKAKAKITKFLQ